MNTNRDRMDDAIDQVATRMTRADDNDAALAARIVASLPERVTWFDWLSQSWAPRLALIAIVVTAGWLVTRRDTSSLVKPEDRVARVEPMAPVVAPASPVENPEPLEPLAPVEPNPMEPLEPLEPLEPVEPRDHEYSLPAITAVAALSLDSLSSERLPEDAPLTVAPLAIADLPLTAETISPR